MKIQFLIRKYLTFHLVSFKLTSRMLRAKSTIVVLLTLLAGFRASADDIAAVKVRPIPQCCVERSATFPLTRELVIHSALTAESKDPRHERTLGLLTEGIGSVTPQPPLVRSDLKPSFTLVICAPGQNPVPSILELQRARGKAEGYVLDVQPSAIAIRGQDAAWLFYGVITLCQLLQGARDRQLTGVTIEDWPDIAFRGFGPFTGGHRSQQDADNPACFRKIVGALAFRKMNAIAFEIDSFGSDDDLRQFGVFCRANFVEPIPLHPFLGMGHMDMVRYVEATDTEFAEILRPVQRAIDTLKPRTFAIGGDELVSSYDAARRKSVYTEAQRAKHAPHEWLALCLNRFHDALASRGIAMAMWADAIIDETDLVGYPCLASCFGGPPDQHARVAGLLPKDIIMWDWHYDSVAVYPTLVQLQKAGFRAVGCPWLALANPEMFAEYGSKTATDKFMGMLGCNWTNPRDLALVEPLIARDGDCFWAVGRYPSSTDAFERFRHLLDANPLTQISAGEHRIAIEADAVVGGAPLVVYSAGARGAIEGRDGLTAKEGRTVDAFYDFSTQAGTVFETCQVKLVLGDVFEGSIALSESRLGAVPVELVRLPMTADQAVDLTAQVKGKAAFRLKLRGTNTSKSMAVFVRRLEIACRVLPGAPKTW